MPLIMINKNKDLAERTDYPQKEQYQVTARKWRPRLFSEVTSQEFITITLKNSIKNNRISHAYLFCGPRGVGKTTVARILAKSLNCKNRTEEGDPCNVCESCREIDNDNRSHPDVFEIDGASNRNIEDVRELKEKVKYGPIRSKYKVFIIDEVHMLTGPSFNALLKTLEEPPEYVVFIFATTAPEKVPLTILGRCQKFDFKRLSASEIITRVRYIAGQEKVKIDEESLFFIAKKGDGSMRDAQGLYDMSAAYCDNNITFEKLKQFFNLAEADVYFDLTDFIKSKDCSGVLGYFDGLMDRGYDMQSLLDGLIEHYRNMLIATSTNSTELIIDSESVKKKYTEYMSKFSQIEIINSLKLILQTEYSFKYSSNQRTLIEALLVELIKFTDTKDISGILDEIESLRKEIGTSGKSGLTSSKPHTEELTNKTEDRYNELKLGSGYNIPDKNIHTPGSETKAAAGGHTLTIPSNEIRSVNLSAQMNDLTNHWTTIMDQIRTESKWISSLLKDSSCELDRDNSNYYIMVHDSKYDILSGHKEYLRGKISTYFGEPLNVHFVRSSGQSETNLQETGKASTQAKKEDESKNNFDRICSILVENFNAKEINSP